MPIRGSMATLATQKCCGGILLDLWEYMWIMLGTQGLLLRTTDQRGCTLNPKHNNCYVHHHQKRVEKIVTKFCSMGGSLLSSMIRTFNHRTTRKTEIVISRIQDSLFEGGSHNEDFGVLGLLERYPNLWKDPNRVEVISAALRQTMAPERETLMQL